MLLAQRERSKWDAGKASGAVYSNDEEQSETVTEAYRLFSRSNPLHPDLWPSGLKFEAEVRGRRVLLNPAVLLAGSVLAVLLARP